MVAEFRKRLLLAVNDVQAVRNDDLLKLKDDTP